MRYKKIVAGLVSVFLSSLLIGACAANKESKLTSTAPQDQATIELDENSIEPDHIVVKQGALITFENDKDFTESIYSKGMPQFDDINAIAPDEEVTIVLNKPGVYEYFCSDDTSKVGKIEVLADNRLSSATGTNQM